MITYLKVVFFMLLPAVLFMGSCTKEVATVPDVEIIILAPAAGQSFAHNQTVQLQADITSDAELHGWAIQLRRKSDNVVIYEADRHTHGTSLQIRQQWINTLSSHTDLVLEVTAALDHQGAKTKKASVDFHCHPN